MTLDYQTFFVPLVGNLDTKTDPKAVPVEGTTDLVNAELSKQGSARKRPGHDALSTKTLDFGHEDGTGDFILEPGGLKNIRAVYDRDGELVCLADGRLYSWAPEPERWMDRGPLAPLDISTTPGVRDTSNQGPTDIGVEDDLEVIAWEDNDEIFYQARSRSTGTVFVHRGQIDAALSDALASPRCVGMGGFVHVVYTRTVSGSPDQTSLRIASVSAGDPWEPPAASELLASLRDDNGSLYFDVARVGDDAVFIANDETSVAVDRYRVGYIEQSGVLGSPSRGLPAPVTVSFGLDIQGPCAVAHSDTFATVWVGAADENGTNGSRVQALSRELTEVGTVRTNGGFDTSIDFLTIAAPPRSTLAEWSALTTEGPGDLGVAVIFIGGVDNGSQRLLVDKVTQNASGTGSNEAFDPKALVGYELASRAFTVGDDAQGYVIVKSIRGFPNEFVVLSSALPPGDETEAVAHAGWFLRNQAETVPRVSLPNVSRVPGTDVLTTVAMVRPKFIVNEDSSIARGPAQSLRVDINTAHVPQAEDVNGTLFLASGCLWQYDGRNITEAGFAHLVDPNAVTLTSGSGGAMAEGQYKYRVYYEWTNARGERERSGAITLDTEVDSGDDQITLDIPTLIPTRKQGTNIDDIDIVVYRTKVNPNVTSRFFRLSDNQAPTKNNTSAESVTFVDTAADSAIEGNELDFRSLGEANTFEVEAPGLLLEAKGRLFAANSPLEPSRVWFSKPIFVGEPPAFNDTMFVDIDTAGGPVTALGTLQNALVVFKRRRIFRITGEGPNGGGLQGRFSRPVPLSTDVGCVDARTLVETPLGLMFQSEKGIYLLDGSFQTQYVGAAVEKFNAQKLTGAVQLPDRNSVLFVPESGRALSFDFLFGQWATWTGVVGSGAVRTGNRYVVAQQSRVLKSNPNTHLDAGQFYQFLVRTGHASGQGLQGYQRVRRFSLLANMKSRHRLRVSVFYNGEPNPRQAIDITPSEFVNTSKLGDATTLGGNTYLGGDLRSEVMQFRRRLQQTRAQTVQFEFSDVAQSPLTDGAGYELIELGLEVGIHGGLNRLVAGKTI